MIALILLVAFVNADEYGTLLKAGQRRFSSDGLKQGDNGVKYDIQLVDRYHSLDHDGEVESIMCGENSVLITANQELKDWREGDVFTGDSRWECGDGVARIVKEITLRKQEEGRFQYFMKTKQAELTDIFKEMEISFVNPEGGLPEGEVEIEAENLKAAPSSYSKTFSYSKEVKLIDTTALKSVISGTVTIPVSLSNMYCAVNWKWFKTTVTYSATLQASLQYTLKWVNEIRASFSKSVEKDLYKFSAIKIDILAGPVVISFRITPETTVGADLSFYGEATATLQYTKKYTATLVIDSEASKKVTYSWADNTAGAKPTFTANYDISGTAKPFVRAGIKVGAGVYGITLISGTPSLKLQLVGTLTKTQLSIRPELLFGFSIKVLWFDENTLVEKVIAQGQTRTINF